jgi:hypothetical protein
MRGFASGRGFSRAGADQRAGERVVEQAELVVEIEVTAVKGAAASVT